MNLLEVIMRGSWLMIPIFICSLIAIAIIIERFLVLRKARINIRHLMMKIRNLILKGDIKEARRLLGENEHYLYSNSVRYKSPQLSKYAEQQKEDMDNMDSVNWVKQRKIMRESQFQKNTQQSSN